MTFSGPQSLFKYQSGRVIALGRVMLASLFLLSIWLDRSQPAQAPAQTYALLLFYVLFALAVAALTWRNWWLDARLAAPAHAIDMAVFTGIVFSTNGYTSPFFLFFILPLLSAAIRWGWRETMLTATALVLLYFTAGLLVAGSRVFELQRFIVRSGHLVILSAILIWFGVHQQFARLFFGVDELDRRLGRDEDPLVQALTFAAEATRAKSGALLLAPSDDQHFTGIRLAEGRARPARLEQSPMREAVPVVLFDLRNNRSLSRRSDGWHRLIPASKLLNLDALRELGATQGLVSEMRTGTRRGWLLLWDIPDLSVDFLDLGVELGRAAGALLDHDALLSAIEEGAAARTRLSLARDVHDSVVQFLAGAAFRVEAIMRGSHADGQVRSDLAELKRLLIEEQGEIRAFVSALRRDRELELAEAVEELKALATRLGRQWSIDCRVDASNDDASIPIRMQLDLQQLLREAVANAVRHGRASRIDVDVGVDQGRLRMEVKDNGSGFPSGNGESAIQPWSLKERVDRAHGSLSLFSEPGCTNLVITLPLTGAAA
ncbi:MAG TPA: ATP-binding protein [Sphingomicrobium sp.]|nr:ATP-binding protein [Sphingomicrobium sp.]